MDATAQLTKLPKQRTNLMQQPIVMSTMQRESTRLLILKCLSKGYDRSLVNTVRRVPVFATAQRVNFIYINRLTPGANIDRFKVSSTFQDMSSPIDSIRHKFSV
jgi:hypothetical protein